ncbi:cupin domain-containing protein [Dyella telluris]|uniref:Cupin domain-containing protein n=1 Tax=Dyella telluris TaxID=2763498 RepID=A0A7G8Q851_9GAMM|nr:cupin domain-containing protein [Dyella telluris]QNK02959.1 cupin domain-containing protein [Dyella telluris]
MRSARVLAWLMMMGVIVPAMATQDESLLTAALTRAPGQSLQALRVTYAPGEASKPHSHDRDAYVYVLQGHVRSQVEGQPLRVYAPGESWFEPAGAHHQVSANASRSEPATFLVVFVGAPPAQPGSRTQSR